MSAACWSTHLDGEAAGQLDDLLLDPAANAARVLARYLLQSHRPQLRRACLVTHHAKLHDSGGVLTRGSMGI